MRKSVGWKSAVGKIGLLFGNIFNKPALNVKADIQLFGKYFFKSTFCIIIFYYFSKIKLNIIKKNTN